VRTSVCADSPRWPLPHAAERLIAAGRSPGTPVAVVRWGTTDRQEVVRTTLDHLADVDLGAPAAIVVGAVAGLDVTAAVGAAGEH